MFRLSALLLTLFSFLIYPAAVGTTLLYLYPLFSGCEFPPAHSPNPHQALSTDKSSPSKASLPPFRLLAFGDPQLEGDTSLPDYTTTPIFPSFSHLKNLNTNAVWRYNRGLLETFYAEFVADVKKLLWSYRKRLDLLGNDYYLAHQYRTVHWWLAPTHVAVLGDLLGSQWISDDEFTARSERFWSRVFRHGTKVPDEIASGRGWEEQLDADAAAWRQRVITVPGNHDVGYAGDLTPERLSRYEAAFGRTNWDVTFTLPNSPPLHTPAINLIALNSMNLDSPALSPALQSATYTYLNDVIRRSHAPTAPPANQTLTLLLTHIPLPKPPGVCTDAEFFRHYADADTGGAGGGALREQNHLSRPAAQPLIEGVFGLSANPLSRSTSARNGLVLTGHDHEGCDVYHYANLSAPRDGSEWTAAPYPSPVAKTVRENAAVPGLREVTLRSMMGEYGGRSGLVSAWWDAEEAGWRVEVGRCDAGVQHWWWGVHVLDLVVVGLGVGGSLVWVGEAVGEYRRRRRRERRRRAEKRRRSRSRSKSQSASLAGTPASRRSGNGMVKTPGMGRSSGRGREGESVRRRVREEGR